MLLVFLILLNAISFPFNIFSYNLSLFYPFMNNIPLKPYIHPAIHKVYIAVLQAASASLAQVGIWIEEARACWPQKCIPEAFLPKRRLHTTSLLGFQSEAFRNTYPTPLVRYPFPIINKAFFFF